MPLVPLMLSTGRNERPDSKEKEMYSSTVWPAALHKAEHLHDIERAGESEWTPWIAILGLVLFFAVVGSLMLGLAEAAAYWVA
jgi:hypothetical protein